jgi:tRNA pseudouridine38-40 synthase
VRLKAFVGYDGTDFYGWQIQAHHPTVQSTIEECLQRICGNHIGITGAGRTDSGVHAYAQVAHFDWDHYLQPEKLILAMNGILPYTIRIHSLQEANDEFHARFDALSKKYIYRIDPEKISSPFHYRFALHYPHRFDRDLMAQCAQLIEGEHDFSAFQASGTDIVTTRRTVFGVETGMDRGLFYVRIHATGFLRKMVRFLVGTMLEIASGKRPIDDLHRALHQQDKHGVGVPAPARGLFLEKVFYEITETRNTRN